MIKTLVTGTDGFIIKDSGERENMETGSRRDTQKGKPRPELVNPLVERRIASHYASGCEKYGERNFELGQKTSRYLTSARRHVLDYQEGKRDEDHLAAIVWNIQGIIMNEELVARGIYPPEMDDRTDYTDQAAWERTVQKPALEFNDRLRLEESNNLCVQKGKIE